VERGRTKFRAIPNSTARHDAAAFARPHHVGSPYDKQNAEWIRDQYASYGWDAHIETFDVLFPTPVERVLEMVAPRRTRQCCRNRLSQAIQRPQHAEQLPTYNAYSIDGDVTGPLVFVNYGIPADYEELERRGISVKGAIVIAKYGGSWRGIKPKVAAEHGGRLSHLLRSGRRWLRGGPCSPGTDASVAGRAARQCGRHADVPR
jgi:N-acetylated-alpha-linked acidic dipeptidase